MLQTLSEQTIQDVRPQLITALQQLNNELQKLVSRMEERPKSASDQDDNAQP